MHVEQRNRFAGILPDVRPNQSRPKEDRVLSKKAVLLIVVKENMLHPAEHLENFHRNHRCICPR